MDVFYGSRKRYTSEQVAKTLRACVQYVVGQPKEVAMGMWDVEKVVLSDVAPMDAKPMDAKLAVSVLLPLSKRRKKTGAEAFGSG